MKQMDEFSLAPRPVLKLALYQPWIYLHGGLERSILELVKRSRHDWTIYTGYYDPKGTFPGFADLGVTTLRRTTVHRGMFSVLRSAVQVALQKIPLDGGVDAVVVWCDGLGDLVTFRNRAVPLMNICCTPLRAAFDPFYEAQALRQRSRVQRWLYHGFRSAFRVVDRRAWRRYSGVMAISNEVKNRIVTGRLASSDSVALAYPGIEWRPELPEDRSEPMILVAGRIMWTKNIQLAIEAFRAARLPRPWRLVVAGYVDKKSIPYLAKLREAAGGDPQIEFVISPSDEEIDDLLIRSSFCLFTPLNEDWGIVPLEAMARGKPVIAVDSGGPRESITHGHTGFLLPPVPEQWARKIAELAGNPDLVRALGVQAHSHVERFSWDRFARDVDDWLVRCVASEDGRAAAKGDNTNADSFTEVQGHAGAFGGAVVTASPAD